MAKRKPKVNKDPTGAGKEFYPEYWACDYCPSTFKTKAAAVRHERRHEGEIKPRASGSWFGEGWK